MGTFRHHAVIVTGRSGEPGPIQRAYFAAIDAFEGFENGRPGTSVVGGIIMGGNYFGSFLVAPDGSKEGWETSNDGDSRRARLVEALRGKDVDFVEIEFGGDFESAKIVAHVKIEAPDPEPESVIVTRHPALVEFLVSRELVGTDVPVIEHATADQVRGKHVFGVLPMHLAREAACVTEIPMNIPQELRGQELTVEQVYKFAGEPWTYTVHGETLTLGQAFRLLRYDDDITL